MFDHFWFCNWCKYCFNSFRRLLQRLNKKKLDYIRMSCLFYVLKKNRNTTNPWLLFKCEEWWWIGGWWGGVIQFICGISLISNLICVFFAPPLSHTPWRKLRRSAAVWFVSMTPFFLNIFQAAFSLPVWLCGSCM